MKQGVHEMTEERLKKECVLLLERLDIAHYTKEEIEKFKKNFPDILSEYINLDRSKICIWGSIKLDNKKVYPFDLVLWYLEKEEIKKIRKFPVPQRKLAELEKKMEHSNNQSDTCNYFKERIKLRDIIEKEKTLFFVDVFNLKRKKLTKKEEASRLELAKIFYLVEKDSILPVFETLENKARRRIYVKNYIGDVVLNKFENRDVYFFETLYKIVKKLSEGLPESKTIKFEALGSNKYDRKIMLEEKAPTKPASGYGKSGKNAAKKAEKARNYDSCRMQLTRIEKQKKNLKS